ncbi:CynX/NimT family MFS transporter [Liquorilactobacillus capillatus]|uniref:Major facilitator superfamily (MFS) profile domain-containing protein n=1 Tax=Liquorilactobacillus capillatus DSM 19910 TaxID=1423731 RepID=A0A0R1LYN9_9LACO|nr:MFS transporter [Liquorilactobacillus capillatus]KRL00505.1 hypothetical protein FC81_GL002036 [Liquorilactobacillus capillatus DSM 19910]
MKSKKTNFRPWVVMLAISLISATCLGSSMVLMGSFLGSISEATHVSIAIVSYYYTVLVLIMALMMPVVPKALASVNNTVIYLIATIAITISLILIGHVTQIWMFFAIAVIIGVAISFMNFVPVGILIDNWFNEKIGLAIGICWAITSAFQGIMSPVLSVWIGSVGWQEALNTLAIIVGILSIPCSFLIKFTPKLACSHAFGKKQGEIAEVEKTQVSTKVILHSTSFWIVTLLMCLLQFPAVLNQMFPTYVAAVGFKTTIGGFMVTAAMIFDIFLNPLVGITGDKFGAEKSSIGWMFVGLGSLGMLILATNIHSAGLAIAAAGINDIIYVFLGTGITALAQSIFGSKAFAKGFSLVGSFSFIIGAFAMPVNNLIVEKFGGFNAVYVFFGILVLASIGLIILGGKNHFEDKRAA